MKKILMILSVIVIAVVFIAFKKEPAKKSFMETYTAFNEKYIPTNNSKVLVTPVMLQDIYEINNLYAKEKPEVKALPLGWCWEARCMVCGFMEYCIPGGGCSIICYCTDPICPWCGAHMNIFVGDCIWCQNGGGGGKHNQE
jgi:hypothetical protein